MITEQTLLAIRSSKMIAPAAMISDLLLLRVFYVISTCIPNIRSRFKMPKLQNINV
jgi:hypothetical protein